MFPPGPHGGLLLGSLRDIRRDPLAFLKRIVADHGDIAHFRLGPFRTFLLNDPADIEQVLVTHQHRFAKGRSLSGARRLFGNGLLTSDGTLHARQRHLLQPIFHRARMDAYSSIITAAAARQCDAWRPGEEIDIAAEMGRLTLAISAELLFGEDGDAVAAAIADPLKDATDALEVAVLPFAAVRDLLPLPHTRRMRSARATLDRVMHDLIERRRRTPRADGDVLSLLLAQCETHGDRMSERQLRDELITLILASYDTTASALAWMWYLLSHHPGSEARLHAEVDAVVGSGRLPQPGDIPDLAYTRMVLAESMRLYPPAWLLARVALDNHDVRQYAIPARSIVVMSPWVVHREAKYFPNPDAFEPDRWRAEPQQSRPRFAYFPFGGGSRGCMGETFAWMEGVLLVSIIAQRWRFRRADGAPPPDIQPGLTLRPKAGIRVRAETRSQPR